MAIACFGLNMHDWRRVKAGIFHDFHHAWIEDLKRALNRGILPAGHYAMAEQLAGGFGPDVITLEQTGFEESGPASGEGGGGIALSEVRPKVSYHVKAEADWYAVKASRVAIRHVSDHRVVAVIEIVSPGNKASVGMLRTFVEKAVELLRQGINLLMIDPFPPTPRDPQGLHKWIWDEIESSEFLLPLGRPLTLASYLGGVVPEAFVEPVAIDTPLPDMPLFISSGRYVQTPLEATYQAAWEAVPRVWRDVLSAGSC